MINQSYFEILHQPETFGIDQEAIKKSYYKASRAYHPDFFTMGGPEEQLRANQMSELINEAYKTLSDPMLRTGYILRRQGVLVEGDKTELDQAFLLEMMEINEAIFAAQEEGNAESWQEVNQQIAVFEDSLTSRGSQAMSDYDQLVTIEGKLSSDISNLEIIKEYYLKRRYLDRMKSIINGHHDL